MYIYLTYLNIHIWCWSLCELHKTNFEVIRYNTSTWIQNSSEIGTIAQKRLVKVDSQKNGNKIGTKLSQNCGGNAVDTICQDSKNESALVFVILIRLIGWIMGRKGSNRRDHLETHKIKISQSKY